MMKTFKYRVKLNQETLKKAEGWLCLCRKLYNDCLEQRIIAYKTEKSSQKKFKNKTIGWFT